MASHFNEFYFYFSLAQKWDDGRTEGSYVQLACWRLPCGCLEWFCRERLDGVELNSRYFQEIDADGSRRKKVASWMAIHPWTNAWNTPALTSKPSSNATCQMRPPSQEEKQQQQKTPNEIDSQLKCFSVKTSGKGQDRREIKKKLIFFVLFFNLKIQSIFFPFYLTKSKTGDRKREK